MLFEEILVFRITDVVEILVIACIIFSVYKWVSGAFIIRALVAFIIIIIANTFIDILQWNTFRLVMDNLLSIGLITLVVLFQPEIRKIIYNIGQNSLFSKFVSSGNLKNLIAEVIPAVQDFCKNHIGCIIVITNNMPLQGIIDEGVRIDSKLKHELLLSIFNKHSPLHDGAVIIHQNQIVYAASMLPLTQQNPHPTKNIGSRHRAAIGISEQNNVFVIVISEVSGHISIVQKGNLSMNLTINQLEKKLIEVFSSANKSI